MHIQRERDTRKQNPCPVNHRKEHHKCDCRIRLYHDNGRKELLDTRDWDKALQILAERQRPPLTEAEAVAKWEAYLREEGLRVGKIVVDTLRMISPDLPVSVDGQPVSTLSSITVTEAKERFMADFKDTGPDKLPRHKNTIDKRELWLGRMVDYAKKHDVENLSDWTKQTMRDFRRTWSQWKVGRGTASKINQSFKKFWRFHRMEDVHETIEEPKKYRRIDDEDGEEKIKYLEPEEWQRIVDAIPTFDIDSGIYGKNNEKRVRAFVFLQRYTGLRISDMVRLKLRRVNFNTGQIHVRTYKNGKRVLLLLPRPVLDALQAWLDVRSQYSEFKNSSYFFWSGNGDYESSRKDWDRTLRRLAAAADVKFSSHFFRHTVGKELAENDATDERIAEILGDTVATVRRHYRHFSPKYQASINQSIQKPYGPLSGEPRMATDPSALFDVG